MTKVFSRATLGKFEDASASIPLRPLDRAFEGAGLRPGDDPGGAAGSRKAQFRRYVAGVDQRDPQLLDRLGDALGALIDEVASSKQDFLVKAAERDGFLFANGVFRPTEQTSGSFAVTRIDDVALIEDRGRRLHLLANESPQNAVDGATELLASVCRTVLRGAGKQVPGEAADAVGVVKSAVAAIELMPASSGDAKRSAVLVSRHLQQLGAVVWGLDGLQGLSSLHARLAVGAAVTFATFVAETCAEQSEPKSD